MLRFLITTTALLLISSAAGSAAAQNAAEPFTEASRQTARDLAHTALSSDLAYGIVRSLTTEVGPRLAGTPQEARAREWAVRELTELGFDNVRVESFPLKLWTRGEGVYEEVAITEPYP